MNKAFYNPASWGVFDIGTTQVENPSIDFSQAVNVPKILFVQSGSIIKTLTEGNGITVAANRLSLTFNLTGADFDRFKANIIKVECSFFVAGVVEYVFDLQIKKTYV